MADCACIKGYFDLFFRKVNENKTILIDTSEWMDGERYKGVRGYDLEIKNIETGATTSVFVEADCHLSIDKSEFDFCDGIYLFSLMNCHTPYSKYGVCFFQMKKVMNQMILDDWNKYREDIIELWLRMKQLEIEVNQFETEQDESILLTKLSELKDFVSSLNCKIK